MGIDSYILKDMFTPSVSDSVSVDNQKGYHRSTIVLFRKTDACSDV